MKRRILFLSAVVAMALIMSGLLGLASAGAVNGPLKEIVTTKRVLKKYKHKLIVLKRIIPKIEAKVARAKASRTFARGKYKDLTKRLKRIENGTISLTRKEIIQAKIAHKKYKNKLLQLRKLIPKLESQLARARKSRSIARRKYIELTRKLKRLRDEAGDPPPSDIVEPGGTVTRTLEIGVGMPNAYDSLPILENKLGENLGIFLWYQSLAEDFDVELAEWLWQRGTKIELAWEPHDPSKNPGNQPEYNLASIIRGDHDAGIYRWARQIRDFGHPVYFRPMCEMNENWVAWGLTNGNQPEEYIPAWRHVRAIFREVGADNALFIWSPNRAADHASAREIFETFYPGSAYVDYVGINGYNWGTLYDTPSWTSVWQSFSTVFGPSYEVAVARTSKPIFISEMASTELGGSKATWTKNAFSEIRTSYPRIEAVVWFNYNKETDWRIDNNEANLNAFRTYALN